MKQAISQLCSIYELQYYYQILHSQGQGIHWRQNKPPQITNYVNCEKIHHNNNSENSENVLYFDHTLTLTLASMSMLLVSV